MTKIISIALLMLLLQGTAHAAGNAHCQDLQKSIAKGTAKEKLNHFLQTQWKQNMQEFPEWATYEGESEGNDRWTDSSLEAIDRRKKEVVCSLEILKKIPASGLKGEDSINYELAKRSLELNIEGQQFPSEYLVIDQMGGIHQSLAGILQSMPTTNKKDYENMIARMERFPVAIEQTQILMEEGLKKNITPIKVLISKVPPQFDRILTAKIEDGPMYKPFVDMRGDLTADEKKDLQKRAHDALENKVYPALKKLKSFLVDTYIPRAHDGIAQSDLPNGKAWYAYLAKMHTTTDLTPEQLHQLGLNEVARITKEMEEVRQQVKFKGDVKDFNHFMLSDSQFFYGKKEDLLTGYRDIGKRIDPELPRLFKVLPQLPYGVREIPEYTAKEAPTAYYEGGSMVAGRAGYFVANAYDLKSRPKWGMEALTLHEAVPGHHLQISLAQDLKDLPKFRTEGGYTAYVEGWGLYAETLGYELGFYKDPYAKYGQLTYEMFRAARLVVDTGMHTKGWSRQQAIDYMMGLMPKSQVEVEAEVDRYIAWPGQALAYKVGQLKFKELREKAHKALGDKFNVRDFHYEVLRHGALPLDVLEKVTDRWIKESTATTVQ